jgi:dTMP kinase
MKIGSEIRFVVFDGSDGTGKSTQLKRLGALLESKGESVHYTRLLGGDGRDYIQNELRKLLLSPDFPADEVEAEEELFGVSDRKGLKVTQSALSHGGKTLALQDRGLPSHYAYAVAKGMTPDRVEEVHGETFKAYSDMKEGFGSLHVVMIPEDERLAMERVQARGEQVTPRLENLETQRAVISELESLRDNYLHVNGTRPDEDLGAYVFVTVRRAESIDQVHQNVLAAIAEAGIEL